jgi:hypothetical protein
MDIQSGPPTTDDGVSDPNRRLQTAGCRHGSSTREDEVLARSAPKITAWRSHRNLSSAHCRPTRGGRKLGCRTGAFRGRQRPNGHTPQPHRHKARRQSPSCRRGIHSRRSGLPAPMAEWSSPPRHAKMGTRHMFECPRAAPFRGDACLEPCLHVPTRLSPSIKLGSFAC